MSNAKHTPRAVRVVVGGKRYTVFYAVDGSVSRVTYVNSVRGVVPLAVNGRIARAAIAKAEG